MILSVLLQRASGPSRFPAVNLTARPHSCSQERVKAGLRSAPKFTESAPLCPEQSLSRIQSWWRKLRAGRRSSTASRFDSSSVLSAASSNGHQKRWRRFSAGDAVLKQSHGVWTESLRSWNVSPLFQMGWSRMEWFLPAEALQASGTVYPLMACKTWKRASSTTWTRFIWMKSAESSTNIHHCSERVLLTDRNHCNQREEEERGEDEDLRSSLLADVSKVVLWFPWWRLNSFILRLLWLILLFKSFRNYLQSSGLSITSPRDPGPAFKSPWWRTKR